MSHAVKESLFSEAIALSPDERERFLVDACAGRAGLLAEMRELIAAHEEPVELTGPHPDVPLPAEEKHGDCIDRYQLLQTIGEGGCGVVWMAEQLEPVHRRVALKIIKLGMDTKLFIARFQAERQALAMMEHPGIAKVHDAGSTPGGRPYFVMELVRGTSITKYCDEHQLTPEARLELFIKVCHAVQHAHQKGVVHRDLKPPNILVTVNDGQPVPKIIDFGIAKATSGRLTDSTLYTSFEHFIGTPVYMSPEQAEMSSVDIDTRTDIYSLGVLLYELLTGTLPFDPSKFSQAPVDQIRQEIRTAEPRRPSAQWQTLGEVERTTAARQRGTVSSQLSGMLKGDLDWIVMRCLEKDRTRRYESAVGLALDLERYLRNEPVSARSPSTAYLLRKLVRRHRVGFSMACTVVALVLVGAIATATMAMRALRAERMQAELRETTRQKSLEAARARLAAEEESQRAEKLRWVRNRVLPEIERLIGENNIAGAFDQAVEAEKHLPDDPAVQAVWQRISVAASIESSPEGADIYAQPYLKPQSEWRYLGKSPLRNVRLAKTAHRLRATKDGFAPLETARVTAPNLKLILHPLEYQPPGMVYVSGQEAGTLARIVRQGHSPVLLSAYFIDRHEVTNREFKLFVDRGGYHTEALWPRPFVKDGRNVGWAEAMLNFRDATGHPGPATWRNGTFPAGEDDHPVSGVSWFEAAAYAESVGKRLPSVHHWRRARGGGSEYLVQLGNFNGHGLIRVGSSQSISMCGAYDLAGNVKEWCWNEAEPEKRYILGGSAYEPSYLFHYEDHQSPWDRSAGNGFRCMKIASADAIDRDADEPVARGARDYTTDPSISDDIFTAYRSLFTYEKSPLAAVTELVDESSPLSRTERISINAAYGDERLPVVLRLPRNAKPPYQTIVYFPAAGALYQGDRMLPEDRTEFLLRGGRAVVFPIYKGTYERGSNVAVKYIDNPNAYADWIIQCSRDLGRTIDYLETRPDIRSGELSYLGRSLGAVVAPMLLAVEDRIKVAILVSGGIRSDPVAPHVEQTHFAPRVRIPVLMLNGRHDFMFPELSQRQMFRLLGTPSEHKQHVLLESPHGVPTEQMTVHSLRWLDRYLGTVQ